MEKRSHLGAGAIAVVLALTMLAVAAGAAPADRYLHVKVVDASEGSSVNVNIPLAMAEKVLPAIHSDNLHDGRVAISSAEMGKIDVQTILEAIHSAPDNEFVTVKQRDQDVHILKSNGNLIVKVRDASEKNAQNVEIKVPLSVADALFSSIHNNELDISAALRALDKAGQTLTISVEQVTQQVHVWVDEQDSQ